MSIPFAVRLRSIEKIETIRKEDLEAAAQMIEEAQKPYIFVGGGSVISGASKEISELAHKIQAPVCDSLMGKGAFSGRRSSVYRYARYAWNKDFQPWRDTSATF